jgi:hypothetical protein
MKLATEVKKFTESKPFYAVAGVGDYAVEKLRELPGHLEKLQARRGELRVNARDLPDKARDYASKAEVYAKDLPDKARDYASKAEVYARDLPERAKGYADVVGSRAAELYEDFAARGRKVVSQVSGEAALELEEVSEAAEPAIAEQATNRKPGAKRNHTT